MPCTDLRGLRSLSARRAWIEITHWEYWVGGYGVALRKESVDRNMFKGFEWVCLDPVALRKESVDRNVIVCGGSRTAHTVALRKESVDRNFIPGSVPLHLFCRSPQGERG